MSATVGTARGRGCLNSIPQTRNPKQAYEGAVRIKAVIGHPLKGGFPRPHAHVGQHPDSDRGCNRAPCPHEYNSGMQTRPAPNTTRPPAAKGTPPSCSRRHAAAHAAHTVRAHGHGDCSGPALVSGSAQGRQAGAAAGCAVPAVHRCVGVAALWFCSARTDGPGQTIQSVRATHLHTHAHTHTRTDDPISRSGCPRHT